MMATRREERREEALWWASFGPQWIEDMGIGEEDIADYYTYYEDSDDHWYRREYDANGDESYFEDSKGKKRGTPKSSKTCEGKVVEVDGIKYKLTAL